LIWEARGVKKADMEIRMAQMLDDFGLSRLRHQNVMSLSGGERRRLELARALATTPRYLLLDEPFTGVDPLHVAEIQEIVWRLKDRDIGILITDHNATALLELVDRVYIIREGEILVDGTPHEVVNHTLARQYYLGENFAYNSRRMLVGAPEPEEPLQSPSPLEPMHVEMSLSEPADDASPSLEESAPEDRVEGSGSEEPAQAAEAEPAR